MSIADMDMNGVMCKRLSLAFETLQASNEVFWRIVDEFTLCENPPLEISNLLQCQKSVCDQFYILKNRLDSLLHPAPISVELPDSTSEEFREANESRKPNWCCQVCTFVNSSKFRKCNMCTSTRPFQAQRKSADSVDVKETISRVKRSAPQEQQCTNEENHKEKKINSSVSGVRSVGINKRPLLGNKSTEHSTVHDVTTPKHPSSTVRRYRPKMWEANNDDDEIEKYQDTEVSHTNRRFSPQAGTCTTKPQSQLQNSAKVKQKTDDWQCILCTLTNKHKLKMCNACGTPRASVEGDKVMQRGGLRNFNEALEMQSSAFVVSAEFVNHQALDLSLSSKRLGLCLMKQQMISNPRKEPSVGVDCQIDPQTLPSVMSREDYVRESAVGCTDRWEVLWLADHSVTFTCDDDGDKSHNDYVDKVEAQGDSEDAAEQLHIQADSGSSVSPVSKSSSSSLLVDHSNCNLRDENAQSDTPTCASSATSMSSSCEGEDYTEQVHPGAMICDTRSLLHATDVCQPRPACTHSDRNGARDSDSAVLSTACRQLSDAKPMNYIEKYLKQFPSQLEAQALQCLLACDRDMEQAATQMTALVVQDSCRFSTIPPDFDEDTRVCFRKAMLHHWEDWHAIKVSMDNAYSIAALQDYYHAVWCTKFRQEMLAVDKRRRLLDAVKNRRLKAEAKKKATSAQVQLPTSDRLEDTESVGEVEMEGSCCSGSVNNDNLSTHSSNFTMPSGKPYLTQLTKADPMAAMTINNASPTFDLDVDLSFSCSQGQDNSESCMGGKEQIVDDQS